MVKAAKDAATAASGGTGDMIGKVVKVLILQQQKVVMRRVLMGCC